MQNYSIYHTSREMAQSRAVISPTLRCILQLRISCPQCVVFNGVKGQASVIVQSVPSILIKGSLLLGERHSPTQRSSYA